MAPSNARSRKRLRHGGFMKGLRSCASYAAILLLLAIFVTPPAPVYAGRLLAIEDGTAAPSPGDDGAWFLQLTFQQRVVVVITACGVMSLPIP